MKYVFLLPHARISGGVRVSLNHANCFASHGNEVLLLINEKSSFKRLVRKLLKKRITWFPRLHKNVYVRWVSDNAVETYINNFGTDVVIADSWQRAKVAIAINCDAKKFQLVQHDERLYHGNPQEVADIYANRSLKKIVVSTWLKEMVEKDFGQEAFLVLNSYEKDIFEPIPEARANDEFLRILILDHSYAWKGTEEAIEIVENLKKKYPHIKLMGYGARRASAGDLYDEYYYRKVNREVAEIHSRADIFLCASWDEGFGLPSLEAMACRTAVVTYDNGGSRDFAYDERTAMVAPRRDQEALQQKLEKLVVDSELRERIATEGHSLAMSWPTWEKQSLSLENRLVDIIKS